MTLHVLYTIHEHNGDSFNSDSLTGFVYAVTEGTRN